jgi:ankyrin repeat protein
VKLMLSWGARVNTEVYNGITLLMIASEDGDMAMVDVLLEGGASINDMSQEGSALTLAVRNNHDSVIERLIAAGVDVNIADGRCCWRWVRWIRQRSTGRQSLLTSEQR